jgi:PPK2 family polyphosphate:nucleotide phosphotransferase
MMIDSPYLVQPGSRIDLDAFNTRDKGKFSSRAQADAQSEKNRRRLVALQEVLYAQGKHAVLIVLQALDAGGKDGTIRFVFSGVNPQGCRVSSFKVPTPLEKAHDFLWRIHAAVPEKGMIGIFNRSHYESVLVERVKALAPEDVWRARYDHINNFEKLLADEGVTIMKFFLHISKDEQRQRLQSRVDDAHKRWKFSAGDLEERLRWDQYIHAFEDAISRCSTEHAPWYVIPADRKWYRNFVISDIIVRTLKQLDMKYPKAAEGVESIVVE